MTDQQSELDRQMSQPQEHCSAKEPGRVRSRASRVSAEAVASGLEFLLSHRHWVRVAFAALLSVNLVSDVGLAVGDLLPGLHFGSGLPFRRF